MRMTGLLKRKVNRITYYAKLTKYYLLLRLSYFINRSFVKPNNITIAVTHRCQLKCIMCSIHTLPDKSKKEIESDEIKNLIDQMADFKVKTIGFDGGEPFLRKDIFDIIAYAREKQIRTHVVSNGFGIDEEIVADISRAGLNTLALSLDGATRETHDHIRGVDGSFDRLIQSAELVKAKNPHICLVANSVIMNQNLEELLEIVRLTQRVGFDGISFQPVLIDNRNRYSREFKDYWVPPSRLSLLKRQLEKLIEYKDTHGYIQNSEGMMRLTEMYFRNDELLRDKKKCFVGFFWMHVSPQGRVDFCNMRYIGNIKENSIREMWNSAKSREIRKSFKKCPKPCILACSPQIMDIVKSSV